MKVFRAVLCLVFTGVLIWALQTKFGDIPPLGNFLNPSTGFWQNAESKNIIPQEKLKLSDLQDEVTVQFDDNRIPHIFAKNDHDLYYVQGYLTAKARLWQMDIQTRSAAGRLSEVVGPKALELDRYHRRMGITYGAEHTLQGIMKDPVMGKVIQAYSDGVNAYIKHLKPGGYPLEFKLLGYAPEEWKPINSAYLLKLMSETLAGGSNELGLTNVLNKFGAKVTNDLFPDYPMHEDPIIPAGTKWDFKPPPIPQPPAAFKAQLMAAMQNKEKVEGIGSNNWAVSGSKTATGYPMLANDPHLNLTFPSIWYQVQMVGPGVNVYGVTLPGAPCVVIGYNQKISWGVTNVDADVLDWYQVKFKDAGRNEYWYNNKWNKVTRKVEVIKVRGQADVIDTVLYTHHGPVVYDNEEMRKKGRSNVPSGNALRWIAHDESDEFKTFYLLNRAANYADYRKALTYYTAPAQNFVFASADNDIAITPNGKLPLKYKDQGKFILDGSNPANDWQGWIPYDQNPTVKNPPRGFVSSANQSSTDPTYPYYINWKFEGYERGKRINDRLGAMQKATVDSLRILQMDDYSIRAQDILPTMLKYLDASKLDDSQLAALNAVKKWDRFYKVNSVGATIFENWWHRLYDFTWRDNFNSKDTVYYYPTMDRTEQLLMKQPNSVWFDNKRTPVVETATDVVMASFTATVDEPARKYGKVGASWQWGKVKAFEVAHLGHVPGLGSGNFESGGAGSTVNALIDGHGPSWRMVVQLGPQPQGYGILPGGQSGNPGSFYYDDMLKTWQQGKLNHLLYLHNSAEKSPRIKTTLTLNK
ncbi:penicillin acylase family protein [Mucilaginibacter sp.]|uniref:penicillin acylase family protein n=1 Tax=Mucilaginibacter sp. TaxID=1882438 RepID=UPI000CB22DD5|nr:penicillin acylase family protein [Mucilaginibacter sp.]PLW90032.1 MAG: penicillin acylase family protein [Mucilaginibacter sp.]PMP64597.1 MAG: penicillin acylase family protein [Mucilaginibacter sp.]